MMWIFHNFSFLQTVLQNAPYVIKGKKDNGETYYYGFCYDILEDFAKAFNFRYFVILFTHKKYNR